SAATGRAGDCQRASRHRVPGRMRPNDCKPMTSDDLAFERDDLDRLFRYLREPASRGVALAVSGGSDSTALMVLMAEWLAGTGQDPGAVFVLTVDHGLRPQSASEARAVKEVALSLGFRHALLPWRGAKPKTGLQAAAR